MHPQALVTFAMLTAMRWSQAYGRSVNVQPLCESLMGRPMFLLWGKVSRSLLCQLGCSEITHKSSYGRSPVELILLRLAIVELPS